MVKLSELVVKYRWFVIIIFSVVTLLMAIPLKDSAVDPDVENMLPEYMSVHLKELEEKFGGMEIIFVLVESDDILRPSVLEHINSIADILKNVQGIERINSIPMSDDDPFDDEKLSEGSAQELQAREKLRNMLKNNNMIMNTLVSEDFKAASILVRMKNEGKGLEITRKVKEETLKIQGPGKISFGGMPVIKEHISEDVPRDMMIFMPLGLLIMLGVLMMSFKQLRGVLLPFLVVIMSIIVSMGLVPLLGWKMTTVTIILPVILIAIANGYGIHIISRYQLDNMVAGGKKSSLELSKDVFRELAIPVLLTGVTTIAGMLCLMTHTVVPAAQLGILSSVGIFFALMASIFFIPAVLSALDAPKPVIDKEKRPATEKMLKKLSNFLSLHPKKLLSASIVLTTIMAAGIPLIIVDSNLAGYYPEDHPVRKSAKLINEKFGGSQVISINVDGDIKDPQVLRKIDETEKKISLHKNVGNTLSIAKLLKLITKGAYKPEEKGFGQIPETKNAVEFFLDKYNEMGDPEELRKLVNNDFTQAQIIAQINSESSETIKKVVEDTQKLIDDDPVFTKITGSGVIFKDLIEKVIEGQVISLFLSFFAVSFLVMLLFKSIVAGIIAGIPLAVSLVLMFGFMGFTGVTLDIATALISSIVIGVGVDYTIHFLWRYKIEMSKHNDPVMAVDHTLSTTGRGIIFNALSVMVGFVVLLFSSFLPIRFFGTLIFLSIAVCLIGSIVLLPSICIVFRPKFLEKKD
ncbi:MAG TPA: MMPL family transporter [bacterium]|jgi:hydrophobe/amphiphile efflux-3 (HAE3) family protein|nr:MMPL family transporter [bacterium]HQN72134.1 MMPL family transporter [bacterium]HQO90986.1 MMPL family transporter [bacterium]